MSKFERLVGVAIGGLIATQATNYLIDRGINPVIAAALAVMTATAFVAFLEFVILVVPKRIAATRLWLLPSAAFEGRWIQSINSRGIRYYSIIEVTYRGGNDFHLKGWAYDQEGIPDSNWSARELKIFPEERRVEYHYAGDKKIRQNPTRIKVGGHGAIEFHSSRSRRWMLGSGSYFDWEGYSAQGVFDIERLTDERMSELIGKKAPTSEIDYHELVKQWHIKYGNKLGIGAPDPTEPVTVPIDQAPPAGSKEDPSKLG